jgi:hypothetical protein
VNEAVSDSIGSFFFSFATPGSPVARLGKSSTGEQEIAVEATTLDGACARFGRPDFIKMDIEGGEVRALRGASHTLRHLRPGWLIELHGSEAEREVKSLLEEAGYAFFDLRGLALNPGRTLPTHFVARPS